MVHECLAAYFNRVRSGIDLIDIELVTHMVQRLETCYQEGGTVYVFGNGGSGATASHFCGDLLRVISSGNAPRFKALCLNDNHPSMMAIANDEDYQYIFRELLINFLQPKDLVWAITGSGNSKNILQALEYTKERQVDSVVCCGFDGGKAAALGDLVCHLPVHDMEVVEDLHMMIIHAIKRVMMKTYDDGLA